ncbi:MAG: hypothetical protein C4344_05155 [Acidimicrobiia bacterium]
MKDECAPYGHVRRWKSLAKAIGEAHRLLLAQMGAPPVGSSTYPGTPGASGGSGAPGTPGAPGSSGGSGAGGGAGGSGAHPAGSRLHVPVACSSYKPPAVLTVAANSPVFRSNNPASVISSSLKRIRTNRSSTCMLGSCLIELRSSPPPLTNRNSFVEGFKKMLPRLRSSSNVNCHVTSKSTVSTLAR